MWFHPEGNPAITVSVARAGGRERPRAWGSPPPTLAHFCTGSLRAIASTPRRSCVVSRLSRCCVEAGGASADALRVPEEAAPARGGRMMDITVAARTVMALRRPRGPGSRGRATGHAPGIGIRTEETRVDRGLDRSRRITGRPLSRAAAGVVIAEWDVGMRIKDD